MKFENQVYIKSLVSPRKFYIGYDITNDFINLLDDIGNNLLFICNNSIINYLNDFFFNLNKQINLKFKIETLKNKYCTKNEIERLSNISKLNNCDTVVAFGGGNLIDCAKVVAFYAKCKLIIIPSIPSNDSPSTSLSVINNEKGEFEEYLYMNINADIIIADTKILIKSPLRYISAGIGDALATFYEAKSCIKSNSLNLLKMKPTLTSYYIGKACFKIIEKNVEKAIKSINDKIVSDEFTNLMESIIYLSGVGAESGGLSCAHAIANGLTSLNLKSLHGENVSFGLLVQCILEEWNQKEINKLIKIFKISKLPLTLEDLGLNQWSDDLINKVAIKSNLDGESMSNTKFKFNNNEIYDAIYKANEFGKMIKKQQ